MRYSIRTMLIATFVIAIALFVFLAEYEFSQVRSKLTSTSPDGQYKVEVVSISKQSLHRKYSIVESRIYRAGQLGQTNYHHLGSETESSEFVDYTNYEPSDIEWSPAGDQCKYPLTIDESVTIWLGNHSLNKKRFVTKNGE